jgi:hypothetical protein
MRGPSKRSKNAARLAQIPPIRSDSLGSVPADARSGTRGAWCGFRSASSPSYQLLFEVYAQAARQPERSERSLRQADHDSPHLMEDLAGAAGCPLTRALPMASVILTQARGLPLGPLAADGHGRVDRGLALVAELLTGLGQTWHR